MKTLKVMSVISLVITGLALLCMVSYNNSYAYETAIGWGIILALWSVAYSIVGLVESKSIK